MHPANACGVLDCTANLDNDHHTGLTGILLQESALEDRLASAGGVPDSLVKAIGAVLSSKELDGAFIAAAVSLPAAAELIGNIPNIDPLLLHNVRCAQAPPTYRTTGLPRHVCSSPFTSGQTRLGQGHSFSWYGKGHASGGLDSCALHMAGNTSSGSSQHGCSRSWKPLPRQMRQRLARPTFPATSHRHASCSLQPYYGPAYQL